MVLEGHLDSVQAYTTPAFNAKTGILLCLSLAQARRSYIAISLGCPSNVVTLRHEVILLLLPVR
jgi:hypothetical protein